MNDPGCHPDSTNGPPVILLAEDEPTVRAYVQSALTRAHYCVLVATDGAEALQLSRAYQGRIDLVLSDVKMPNMVGPDLAQAIIKERPGIHVVFMSGHGSGIIPVQLQGEVLRKPFLPKQLYEKIEQTLLSRSRVPASLSAPFAESAK
jgi:CheY-like chemotaxis protein